MIDSGATSSFISERFARLNNIKLNIKRNPIALHVIDGRPIASGLITHECTVIMGTGKHLEEITLNVTSLGRHDVVLGLPWLKKHDPKTDWTHNTLRFVSNHCFNHCLPKAPLPRPTSVKENISATLKAGEIPEQYAEFADIFNEQEARRLPPHRPYDCSVEFIPGAVPKSSRPYKLSPLEENAMKEWVDDQLAKGFIRPSKSPAAAPVFFVKKADGGLRPCVDYRQLNQITVKNRYPIPLSQEIVDRLTGATKFTKIDLRSGYNLIRIKEGDEWKLAFQTKYGTFEPTVMNFGYCNAPSVFQNFMNDIFHDMLDKCIVIYLDDLLIYTKEGENHDDIVKEVLRRLRLHGLYAKPEKCRWGVDEVDYLGLLVSNNRVRMDKEKVKAILEWKEPQNVHDVQSFLGFANFYRRFINGYSKRAKPLTRLLKKDTKWQWNQEQQDSFDDLKDAFTKAPILAMPNPLKQYIIEPDASQYATGAVLSQKDKENLLRPVAYMSHSFNPAEQNYDIYDRELLAIVHAFEGWRHYLEGSPHPVLVYSDHKNLETFRSSKVLNRRQARWSLFLEQFDFVIHHVPGKSNGKADALSRQPGLRPEGGVDNPAPPILKPRMFASATDEGILNRIRQATFSDESTQAVRAFLTSQPATAPAALRDAFKDYRLENDIIMQRDRIYIPNDATIKRQILETLHDHPTAGHPGRAKTLELVSRDYIWPGVRAFVNRYVDGCESCQRTKYHRSRPHGLLKPLPTPTGPWQDITYDMITGLPESNGHDAILVVVDRLTKMAHFTAIKGTMDSEGLADIMMDRVWKHHGTPLRTISDRGSVFISDATRELYKLLGITPLPSTAYHPQTDGQSERVNQVLEQYLRQAVTFQQDDWIKLLPLAEFAYNNAEHTSTGMSPFFANYGYNPTVAITPSATQSNPNVNGRVAFIQKTQEDLKAALKIAADTQARFHDRHVNPTPVFAIGSKVWLDARDIRTVRPSNKLDDRWMGPFTVEGRIGSHAYRLALPRTMRIHPVFHVSKIHAYQDDTIEGRQQEPPPPVVVEGETEYEVEHILDSRWSRNKLQYFVHWKGYGSAEDSWQDANQLDHAQDAVLEYHNRYPTAASPTIVAPANARRRKLPRT
jgi:RNase H-like domain found in reverse transcriptase/Reverse transcriptase (RNA-dependent DNA polymerase)/Integrase zinc binding domain/Chromo (CHRromatin Organisation MOdifier) domain/Integrase core domain/Retroviral aspartyl protease